MTYTLQDRYTADAGTVFLSGLQALARLPFDQLRADRELGRSTAALVSGYPGSPLGGFDGAVAAAGALHPDLPVSVRPAVNEEYAATAMLGSQLAGSQVDARYDGVVGIWYGKAPGVDRATDAFRHGVYGGTTPLGGVVALVGDDPTAKSSSVPSSSVGILQDLHVPILYPADPAAAMDLGRHAIALSRCSGLWTSLKIVADVADGTAAVDLGRSGFDAILPDGIDYGRRADGWLLTPHTLDIEREIFEVRYEIAREYATLNRLNEVVVDPVRAWIGIVASGITYGEVRAALTKLGLHTNSDVESVGIRMLNMRMPLPFDPNTVRRFAEGLDEVLVIEEKQPHLEQLVMAALYGSANQPLITGKHDEKADPLVPGHGGLDADAILPVLRRRLGATLSDRLKPQPPRRELIPVTAVNRTPYYCSGCPHNRSTETPPGSLVGAGIGCHTMALMMEPERVGDIVGLTPMGNEGTQWIGMSDFVDRDHFIQNLGDGTYFHSGQLAITAAIAANVNITYKLLYNGAVAMTGGQRPQGQRSLEELVNVLLHQGVAEILVTTDDPDRHRGLKRRTGIEVWDRTHIVRAQERLARVHGVSVLIHDQPCAAELRRARKRGRVATPTQRVAINHRVCEGCGDCGRVSNCLSVQPVDTPFGRKTAIDQSSCNLDYSCLEGDCPAFISVDTDPPRWRRVLGRVLSRRRSDLVGERSDSCDRKGLEEILRDELPAPVLAVPDDEFSARIAGIGGTGVVTVAQIIGTAAMLDGYNVRGLDQVGLSQKAGPVVSDLRLSRDEFPESNRVGAGKADLLLVLDQLVGALPKTLATASPERTVVIGSTTRTPTGEMIRHPDVAAPTASTLADAFAGHARPDGQLWADLTSIAISATGSAVAANVIGVGMAVQAGAIPVRPECIEEAITLNGTAVADNIQGFRLGRHLAHDPATVTNVLGPTDGDRVAASTDPFDNQLPDLEAGLRARVLHYATDLAGYQNHDLARRYLEEVSRINRAEQAAARGSTRLTDAVAENLHRVLAYKDEYEVARLLLDPDGRAEAERIAGETGIIKYNLHPPLLRELGLGSKIGLGTWTDPILRLLASGKRLRGTPLDVFGKTKIRRAERGFIDTYRSSLSLVEQHLHAGNLDLATQIAELPDLVRGYEQLKLARLDHYERKLAELNRLFLATPNPPALGAPHGQHVVDAVAESVPHAELGGAEAD